MIEANNLLQLERNDLAEKLNNHRRDIDDAKSEAAKARADAEVIAKQHEEKSQLIDKYHQQLKKHQLRNQELSAKL